MNAKEGFASSGSVMLTNGYDEEKAVKTAGKGGRLVGHASSAGGDTRKLKFIALLALLGLIGTVTFAVLYGVEESKESNNVSFLSSTQGSSQDQVGNYSIPIGTGSVRTHYIGIDEVEWDYSPESHEINACSGVAYSNDQLVYVQPGSTRIGSVYTKALFRAYTNGSFSEQAAVEAKWAHLGTLGPVIQLEQGDVVAVTVKNSARFPFNFHASGLLRLAIGPEDGYVTTDVDGDPALSLGDTVILPGEVMTTYWMADNDSAPGVDDVSSTVWLYRSVVEGARDNYAGLYGPIIVTKKGSANDDGSPKDVDTQFVTLFMVSNENSSPYLVDNLAKLPDSTNGAGEVNDNGTISLGNLDAGAVLQALYQAVAIRQKTDPGSLSSKEANQLLQRSNGAVGSVNGVSLGNITISDSSLRIGSYDDIIAEGAAQAAIINMANAARQQLLNDNADDFEESNLMHSINGHVFCNGHDALSMSTNNTVRWYTVALGNEVDLHTPHWHGHTLQVSNRTVDLFNLLPFTSIVADMVPDNPGMWLYHCHVNDHIKAGMVTKYTVSSTPDANAEALPGVEREYFIQIEEQDWNYAPSGVNQCTASADAPDPELPYSDTTWRKARYIEYTDQSFTTRRSVVTGSEYTGILGPILRAEVGDTIVINARNNASYPFSLHPHGWEVPERAGPGPSDPSSIVWLYHSHDDETADTNAGLVGAIIVTRKGSAISQEDPSPSDVDKEVVQLYAVMDENTSKYALTNGIARLGSDDETEVEEYLAKDTVIENNLMHSVNGYIFCNAPAINLTTNERVRWHFIALGTEVDMHTPTFHEDTLIALNRRRNAVQLLPASMVTADFSPQRAGTFQVGCQVYDHVLAGMLAQYSVTGDNASPSNSSGSTRTYYIQAEEQLWDYAPEGVLTECSGAEFSETADAETFIANGPQRVGSVYWKALYRGYKDDNFNERLSESDDAEHLGLLGPVMRAAVGDTLQVVFRNNLTREANLHIQGFETDDAPVAPGDTVTYTWNVTDAYSPVDDESSSIAWWYLSSVDTIAMTYAGLLGPLIVTRRGASKSADDPFPNDTDRELMMAFGIWNENQSPYIQKNVFEFAQQPLELTDFENEDFQESNLMHSINGRLYCNLQGLQATVGERVRWHFYGIGSELDLHSPNWQGGQTVLQQGAHAMSVLIMPGTVATADTLAATPGSWVLHCPVNDHHAAGMFALYSVSSS
eukprot:jgi/Chlat1/1692/Chrsp127S01958